MDVCDKYNAHWKKNLVNFVDTKMIEKLEIGPLATIQDDRVIFAHSDHYTADISVSCWDHWACTKKNYLRIALLKVPYFLSSS